MYEVAHKVLGGTMLEYFQAGKVRARRGNRAPDEPLGGTFRCSDGWIVVAPIEDTSRLEAVIARTQAAGAADIDAALETWLATHNCREAQDILSNAGIPCSKVMMASDMAEDAHYRARAVHLEWDDPALGRVRGVGIVPKFSSTPGKVWRGAAGVGRDNELVYRELLGVSDDQLQEFARDGLI
jgi:crotonobetainyl-CoA:carnitine CoA-transferase CaiB-like acyl-CoA transferase